MKPLVCFFVILIYSDVFCSTSLTIPAPISSGMEASAVLCLPEMVSNKTQRLTISVEASNVSTNQLEIWFCNDTLGSRESREYLIGFDEGSLISGYDTVESVELNESLLSDQNVAFTTFVRSRINPFRTKTDLTINGAAYPVDFQLPHLWRSIRVVSRGLDYPQPRLSESLITIGFSIRVR